MPYFLRKMIITVWNHEFLKNVAESNGIKQYMNGNTNEVIV